MINIFTYTNSKGREYFLHTKEVTLKNSGAVRNIYFFARKRNPEHSTALPDGYKVIEGRNGLPVLKKV